MAEPTETNRADSTVDEHFDEASWDMPGMLSFADALTTGEVLLELADEGHDEIVVCTADLARPGQVIAFQRRYPERFYNFGIAERNMLGAAAGLATTGWLPVISNYSFFLALLGYENIRTDLCYPNLKVRMIGTHSGIATGSYGTSHHCNEDIGALRCMVNMTLMAPCDGNAIKAAFRATLDYDGPIYLRAGAGQERQVYNALPDWRIGGSNTLREGAHATVLAIGQLVSAALDGAQMLARDGIEISVVDMYSIRPLDREPVRRAACEHGVLISAEEHNVTGGFGAAIAEVVAEEGLGCRLWKIGLPDEYSILGPPADLYHHYGLDGAGVAQVVRQALET